MGRNTLTITGESRAARPSVLDPGADTPSLPAQSPVPQADARLTLICPLLRLTLPLHGFLCLPGGSNKIDRKRTGLRDGSLRQGSRKRPGLWMIGS